MHAGAKAFERFTACALGAYVGGPSQHFGWPRDPHDEVAFAAAVDALARRMDEEPRQRREPIPSRINDQRLDAVSWRDVGDNRSGKVVLLSQCAIGADWDEKSLDVKQWKKLILFAVDPLPAVAFPFVPEAMRPFVAYDWDMLTAAGIPLDRIRLASLVSAADVPTDLLRLMTEWTQDLLAALPS
jgi:hypothetical protein